MLSSNTIRAILPTPTLADIDGGDIDGGDLENDITIVLNWIRLSPQPIKEPTPRVKSAIRSILKDDSNQLQFTKLLNNSINQCFTVEGVEASNIHMVLASLSFDQIMAKLIDTKRFYDTLIYKLNIPPNSQCLNLFNKNLIQNFSIIFHQQYFQSKLSTFVNQNFLQFLNNSVVEQTFMFFKSVGMVMELLQVVVTNLIKNIQEFIKRNCSSVWNQSMLVKINNYIQVIIYPNFQYILKLLGEYDENYPDYNYLNYLLKISYNELISVRINEIFKIILDFPHSEVSLVELNKCLSFKLSQQGPLDVPQDSSAIIDLIELNLNSEFYQRNKLVENFNHTCQIELLNSGINTINLIKIYIKVIKSFLIIDPKGVLLDKVIRPIRLYMKNREDIISKLVNGLLNNDPDLHELSIELQNTELNFKNFGIYSSVNSDDFSLTWVPDPIDALPDFKKFKINDIIESLISIFDSKDLFVVEFTKIFGNKLLNLINTTASGKDPSREIELAKIFKTIKLLKLRFGKAEFFNLDIMVKDFMKSDSFKIDKFNPLILSHLYWTDILPSTISGSSNDDTLRLPPQLLAEFNTFNDHFKRNNFNRYLKLLPNFGNVKLAIGGKEYVVSVEKAAIIYMFAEDESNEEMISVSTIADKLNMPSYMVQDALKYWCNEKVLLEVMPEKYMTNED